MAPPSPQLYVLPPLFPVSPFHPVSNAPLTHQRISNIHQVAPALATANIPILLTPRPAPDSFEKRSVLAGPPLTRSPASILHEAGVLFGLAAPNDAALHEVPIEAAWAAKHAGLSDRAAVALVSTNVEKILGLRAAGDFVVWEGDPLSFGASVALAVDGEGKVGGCWPESS